MKILVIANANSEWVYNFISLFQGSGINVSLCSYYRIEQSYYNRYDQLGIHIIRSPEYVQNYLDRYKHSFMSKVFFLSSLIRTVRGFSRTSKWDIINIQYVDPHLLRVFALFPALTRKLVLSYWGSDLMRENSAVLGSITEIVSNSLGSTFDNGDLVRIHENLYPDYQKRSIIMLPLPILDDIERLDSEKQSEYICIDGQTIKRDKILICIGYNGRRQQQHDMVLNQLKKMNEKIKSKISLLFPFTYSVDKYDTYIDDLKVQISESGIESYIFERLLSNEDLARLRIATDVFINAQTTDAFSGSVCEALYAGGILVNAKWLHYEELDKYNLEYIEYNEFKDIPPIVERIIKGFDRNHKDLQNRVSIRKLRSIENCRQQWISYFSRLIE